MNSRVSLDVEHILRDSSRVSFLYKHVRSTVSILYKRVHLFCISVYTCSESEHLIPLNSSESHPLIRVMQTDIKASESHPLIPLTASESEPVKESEALIHQSHHSP